MGRSMGGMIATNIANTVTGKALFKNAMVVICPAYELHGDSLKKKLPALKVLQYIKPYHIFCTKSTVKGADPKRKDDPRGVYVITPVTGLIMDTQMRLARDVSISQINTPILFLEGKDDVVVSNTEIKNCAEKAMNPANKYVIVEGDHATAFFEKQNYEVMVKESINFLDSILMLEC